MWYRALSRGLCGIGLFRGVYVVLGSFHGGLQALLAHQQLLLPELERAIGHGHARKVVIVLHPCFLQLDVHLVSHL